MKRISHYLSIARRHFKAMLLIVIGLTLVGTQVYGTTAQALDQDDVEAIYNWPFWNPNECSSSSSSSGTTQEASDTQDIADSANAKEVFIFLTNSTNKFTAAQAAGIVGNLWIESKVIPTQNQIGGPAYGIAQWQDGRLDQMRSWTAANGMDSNSLTGQQAFIIEELSTDYSDAKAAVLQDTTPAAAAADWNKLYEQSADTTNDREEAANSAYAAFQSLAGSSSANAVAAQPSCVGSSGTPDCSGSGGTVTGDAEILCYAQKWQGVWYLWGGGHSGWSDFDSSCIANGKINSAGTDTTTGKGSSTEADPGPCAVDCSGLVSMALDWAFKQSYDWNVGAIQTTPSLWKSIPFSAVQPGDVVTVGVDVHVEIVVSYDASTQEVTTFGAHYTGSQDGEPNPPQSPTSYWTGGAFEYIGPQ